MPNVKQRMERDLDRLDAMLMRRLARSIARGMITCFEISSVH